MRLAIGSSNDERDEAMPEEGAKGVSYTSFPFIRATERRKSARPVP